MTELATVTSLGFSIFSTYSGRGVTSARRDINSLTSDLERNRAKLGEASRSFFSLSTAAAALGPALGPLGGAMLGIGGAAVTMGASAGAGLGIFGLALKGNVDQVLHLKTGVGKLQDNLELQKTILGQLTPGTEAYNKEQKKVAIAQDRYNHALADASPIQRTFLNSVMSLKDAWGGFLRSTQAETLTVASVAVHGLADGVKKLAPAVHAVAPVALSAANAFKHWTDNNLQGWVSWIAKNGVPILDNFVTIGKNLGRVFGDMLKAFAPMADTMSNKLAILSAKLKGWADGGGFVRFLDSIKANGPATKAFFDALGAALKNVSIAMAGLGPVSLNLSTLLLRLVAALPPSWIQAIVLGFVAFRAVMLTMAIISVVSSAIAILQVVLGTLNFVLVALGITWNVFFGWLTVIILGVAALVVGIIFLVKNWTTVWNTIKQTALTVWNFLTHGLGMLVLALLGPIGVLIILGTHWREIWNGMKVVAMAIWTGLGVAWRATVQGLTVAWNAVSLGLRTAWNAVWNGMGVAAKAVWTGLTAAWRAFITGMATVWNATSAALKASWSAVWNAMGTAARAVWNALTAAWRATTAALMATLNAFGQTFQHAWSGMWNIVKAAATAVWNALKTAFTAFSHAIMATLNALGQTFQKAWQGMWNIVKSAANAAWNAMKTGFTAFSHALMATLNALGQTFQKAWQGMWNIVKKVATDAWNALKKAFDAFKSALISATNALMKAMKSAWEGGAKAIGAAWSTIKKLVRDPIEAVVNVVYNNGIVKLWNVVAGVFGAKKLGAFHLPGFATGGPVNGPGNGTSDSVVARLSAGEHVWTAKEVAAAGGHAAVMSMRAGVMGPGYKPAAHGDKQGGYALGGIIPNPIDVIGDIFKSVKGVASAAFNVATGFGGDILKKLGGLALGEIAGPINGLIQKAANTGKDLVKKIIPGSPLTEQLIAGGNGPQSLPSGPTPGQVDTSPQGATGKSNGMIQMMADAIKNWITAHDISVTGGGNTAEAQKWADAQVGKPYSLGSFGSSFDCSSFMSGIAQIILGHKASPLFTTFAFTGAKAGPATFEKDLKSPFQVGVENRGVGHMAGTLNGKNYEATPPAVRSGPSARGAHDPMFDMVYGMKAAIGGGQGVIPTGQHLAIIDAALAAAGVPPPGTKAQWEAGLNTLITRESAWNSSAINNTDSNAAAGHPSQGLAQVIPSTFAAFHVAGTSSNILDPIANVAAAIRYIVATYGNITNVQQANSSLPPKGYRHGTQRARKGWHMIDEDGGEWINFKGGEKVLPHGRHPKPAGDGAPVHVEVHNHWPAGTTADTVARAEGPMAEKLRQACHAGVGGRNH